MTRESNDMDWNEKYKQIKSFRITPENQKNLVRIAKKIDRSEGWLINQALEKYFDLTKESDFILKGEGLAKAIAAWSAKHKKPN